MSEDTKQPRSWIVLAGIPVVVVALVFLGISWAKSPNQIPMRDFVEYWSAGAVNLRQGNPYDSDELLPIQREITRDPDLTQATMMWNPPWALAIFTPLALLPGTSRTSFGCSCNSLPAWCQRNGYGERTAGTRTKKSSRTCWRLRSRRSWC